MKAIQLIRDSLLWYALAVTSLALVIGGLICLIRSIQARRGKGTVLSVRNLNAERADPLFNISSIKVTTTD